MVISYLEMVILILKKFKGGENMRPFLKWAGGKRQLLPYIKEYINEDVLADATFYEPFIGGGSLFFHLEHGNSIINDFNEEIINCYKVIKKSPNKLIKQLKIHEQNHSKEYFYQIRSLDRNGALEQMSDVEKAARTIYLNRTCYNGLYRVNRAGQFNTPMGRYVNPMICDEENILEISRFLKKNKIIIRCCDFSKAVKDAKSGDWIYFDPPYDYEESGFVSYVKEGFSHEDLKRLKVTCDELIAKGCQILLSNNDTQFVRDTFNSDNYEIIYTTKTIKANRNINSNVSKRKKVDEVLIYGSQRKKITISTSK